MSQNTTYATAIISTKRAANVQAMCTHFPGATWHVGIGESSAYRDQGAGQVMESDSLVAARNQALSAAFNMGVYSLQVSDDLRWFKYQVPNLHEVTGIMAAELLYKTLHSDTTAHLAGIPPTDNPYFAKPRCQYHHFIIGDFCMVKPTPLRFDAACTLKEDYDYTLAHLLHYGRVVRDGRLLAAFRHYDNTGGACDYRTDEREHAMMLYLINKWNGAVYPNSKRKNELLIRRNPFPYLRGMEPVEAR